jgi:hypothetical protein
VRRLIVNAAIANGRPLPYAADSPIVRKWESMPRFLAILLPVLPVVLAVTVLAPAWQPAADGLEEGFRNPPPAARPHLYFMLLNGYVDRAHVDKEIAEYARAGFGGLCVFDVGARGDAKAQPPAGPAFLGPESVADLAHIIRTAGRHGMEVDLSVASSWDMGGSWVKPADASMTLVQSSLEVDGGKALDVALPFPTVPAETPKAADGRPVFAKDAAVIAIPAPDRVEGYEFDFELTPPRPHRIERVVLYNNPMPEKGEAPRFAKDFVVSVSSTHAGGAAFRPAVRGTLEARGGPQEFRLAPVEAQYVRLHILNGHGSQPDQVELAEFEVYSTAGANVALGHRATRLKDSAYLMRFTSARGQLGPWAADNLHDGIKEGPRGSWGAGGATALFVRDHRAVVDLTARVDAQGRLRWDAPAGRWLILRYVCVNTGERLKVPSPNSDGLATDHFSAAATRRHMEEVIRRLRTGIPDLAKSALKDLYLASYEVRGQIWSPFFLEEFRKRRGYDLTPFLPILNGGRVDNEQTTERVMFDFRKTQGELLVDAYYRAAVESAHRAGLTVESEAGGPGPPIHQVPVDALLAQGAMDSVRGEFWPDRMENSSIWVVKETASAAHVYGKRRVHMESFTTMNHWQEGPADLKASADRAFAEGMNHVVWHTASHQPPLAGKPGWVYYAGTHLNQNVTWWPMAHAFLAYLARSSFLLQQGVPVSDVLRYYGDQGYNFVLPKRVDPALGHGYDYDAINADALLRRVQVRNGKLVLPEGTSYEILTLPDREDIDLAVLKRVEQLVREGATVVGRKPLRSSGYSGFTQRDREVEAVAARMWGACDGAAVKQVKYGQGRVVCGLTPGEALRARGVGPDFRCTSRQADTNLDFVHRSAGGAEIYFVHNKTNRWAEVHAEFRVKGRQPELWDAATGERRDQREFTFTASGTRFDLRLEPEGSIFVVFRRPAEARPPVPRRAVELPAPVPVAGPWSLRFWGGPAPPAPLTLTALRSWTESADPREKYFSGIAEYETELNVPAGWLSLETRVWLDLGDLWAVAEVRLNGRDLGVVWKRPFRVDITAAARAGANRLAVRVANNWANRLVGDALSPAEARFARTNVTTTGAAPARPWRDTPLRESGLLGPVRMMVEPAGW